MKMYVMLLVAASTMVAGDAYSQEYASNPAQAPVFQLQVDGYHLVVEDQLAVNDVVVQTEDLTCGSNGCSLSSGTCSSGSCHTGAVSRVRERAQSCEALPRLRAQSSCTVQRVRARSFSIFGRRCR